MNLDDFQSIDVDTAPLEEPYRIVAKVNELMALCDWFEASLSSAENTCSRLLEALIADALTPVARESEVLTATGRRAPH